MANTNGPFGLRPVRKLGGGYVTATQYDIAYNYATVLYTGDIVSVSGTGRNLVVGTTGNSAVNVGVFAGCWYKTPTGDTKFSHYWPGNVGNTDAHALVYDDPDLVFEVQADGCAAADVGIVADWAGQASGSTATGLSGVYAVVSGKTDTSALQLRVLGLANRPNNAYGSYAKVEVVFALHAYKTGTSGTGVN